MRPHQVEGAIASQVPRLPPWGRLEQVALFLAEHEHYRDLVTFVEAWSRQGTPTLPSRLALCEAYIALRLMDRAWSRLRPIVDEGRGPMQAVRLSARYLLLRGWHHQALGMAEAGLVRAPGDVELLELKAEAASPGLGPEQLPEPSTLSDMLRLAEAYMARGFLVRARGLLERARRRVAPQEVQRVEDLLWAMAGDFSTESSVAALCEELGPEEEVVDLTERVSNVPMDLPPDSQDGDRAEGFRQLFRDLGPPTTGTDGEEDTSVSQMARDGDLRGEFAAPARGTDGSDNTEILRVVRRSAAGDTGTEALSVPSDHDADYIPAAENEDDIVVLTRRSPSPGPAPARGPLSGLHSDKEFEHQALNQSKSTRREGRARSSSPRVRARPPATPVEEDAGPIWPWMVVAAGIMAGSVGIVFLLGALFGSR